MEIEETVKSIEILGLRGFCTNQLLELAVPNGKAGSGLTIVVGQNNSGKSTITEAFAAVSGRSGVVRSFS
jgi:AAA15 family ATPase/GTPase